MALTTTQINQAYIAILGRAAIGTESRVAGDASVSDVAASLIAAQANNSTKEVDDAAIFQTLSAQVLKEATDSKLSNADFVESLYTAFLNRGSDDEGKAFWLKVLNDGASREDLVASFTNAIIVQKAANTQDYQNYVEQVAAQSDNFVESLYTNLLGRDSDEAGKAYWSGLIADGASYADVVASFTAAAVSQGKGTEDGVTIANKLEVANYATTSITSFSKIATKQNIEEIKANIKQAIASTNKDSTADTLAESKKVVDTEANTYKAPSSISFSTKEDVLGVNDSGELSTTKATNFTGSINLDNSTKGTIQANDRAYGNPEFAKGNILTVNVTGTTTKKDLNLNTLPTTVSGIENLEIKASAASVSGAISTNYKNTVTINAGYTGVDNKQNASDITVNHTLDTYNAGAKADKLTVNSGASIENVNMGAGNDTIILQGANGATPAAKVTNINAGTGTDTLQLTTAASGTPASGDYTTIKSITDVETITLTSVGAQTHTASISYDAIKKSNKAFSLASDNEGSGSLTIKAGNNTDIDVSSIKNGEWNKDANGGKGDYVKKVASLTIDGVGDNATIKLEGSVNGNKLVDKIVLAANAKNVEITNFAIGKAAAGIGEGDHIYINASAALTGAASGATTGVTGVSSANVDAKGVLTASKVGAAAVIGEVNKVQITSVKMAQDIIAKTANLNVANKVYTVNIDNVAYIIETGAVANNTADDVVIELIGVDSSKGLNVDGSKNITVLDA